MEPMRPIFLPASVIRSIERDALAHGVSEVDLVRRAVRDYLSATPRSAQLSLFAGAAPVGAPRLATFADGS